MEVLRRFPRVRTALCWVALTLTVCDTVGGGVVRPGAAPMDCPQHFGHKVKRCLEPYWSVAALVTSQDGSSPGGISVGLAKRLCLQFEIALVCLHTALTQCPSHSNIRYVQSKLGSNWAMEIRNLCVGQSGHSTRQVPGEDSTVALTQAMEPLDELSSQDSATDEEDTVDDDRGVVDEEIIVLVPENEEGEFYHDIVVDVRKRAKLKPRYHHHHHHPRHYHRLRGGRPRLPVIDIQVYNDIFDEEKRTLAANSAAVAATTISTMPSSIVLTFIVVMGSSSPVILL